MCQVIPSTPVDSYIFERRMKIKFLLCFYYLVSVFACEPKSPRVYVAKFFDRLRLI